VPPFNHGRRDDPERRAVDTARSSTVASPTGACGASPDERRLHAEPMDTTALVTAAAALDTHGEVLVARAHQLARQGAAMRWHSPAARCCRTVVESVCRQLLVSGTAVGALADRLRGCAARAPR
jgi:hypothetical protein